MSTRLFQTSWARRTIRGRLVLCFCLYDVWTCLSLYLCVCVCLSYCVCVLAFSYALCNTGMLADHAPYDFHLSPRKASSCSENEPLEHVLVFSLQPDGFWRSGEHKWQVLACCMEITDAIRSGDPENFVSHFPIHQVRLSDIADKKKTGWNVAFFFSFFFPPQICWDFQGTIIVFCSLMSIVVVHHFLVCMLKLCSSFPAFKSSLCGLCSLLFPSPCSTHSSRMLCLLSPLHGNVSSPWQDGSCNGLQHYAALGRDQEGAEQVNLEPSETAGDVYMGVAKMVGLSWR